MIVCQHRSDITAAPTAVAIGMFDGIHAGHQQVLQQALDVAQTHGYRSAVLTFSNHPQTVLSATPPRLLSTLAERLALLEAMGVELVAALPFNHEMQCLGAQSFVQNLLAQELGARHVAVGYDFCFGVNREGNGDTLKTLAQQYEMGVTIVPPVRVEGQIVSSTVIRKLLTFGDVATAAQLLSRFYQLTAPVISGLKRGRQLGFPTANLCMDALALRAMPGVGTYAGWAELSGERYPAVCNIGLSPTFTQDALPERVEVHVLGYTGADFYGAPLTFAFTHRLRDESRFNSVDALTAQIQLDCDKARLLYQAAFSPASPSR